MPTLLSKRAPSTPLILDDGLITRTRLATPDDYRHVVDVHARCSLTSRANRYRAARFGLSLREWQRLVTGPRNRVLLTTPHSAPDHVVAMTTMAELPDEPDVCDIAILIADLAPDSYQSRGLGTQLAKHVVALAGGIGYAAVSATVAATNWRALLLVEHVGGPALPQTAHLRTMALLGALAVPDPAPSDEVELRIQLRGTR
ncbi:hypothetical protein OG800_49890 (plasmid) [Streptomyces sp. NBC_00445]|uniref:hypothetical protein n=1 Tax=Streptomyces sp. NBC_00445 TaxID=2975745 RepID=UPI002E1ABEA2